MAQSMPGRSQSLRRGSCSQVPTCDEVTAPIGCVYSVVGGLEGSTYMDLWDALKPSYRMNTAPGKQALGVH